jgi:hypothetical protein
VPADSAQNNGMDDVLHLLLRWDVPLFFLAVFVLCALTNFNILFGLTPSMRALHAKGQRRAIAFWNWPEPDLSFWVTPTAIASFTV